MTIVTLTDINGQSFEADTEDIQADLEDAGYGVVILPESKKFFCFWSENQEILKKGHEIRKEFEDTGIGCGYVLNGVIK